ncbi:hypothetical protein [Desulfitobacterium dichloroeliminans]|uniref:hypothetical protein n=1 Tax=Desulfitobacterium dichloroeliminans TaxID=233055 RepID=UPI0002F6D827|nr:hypothetical protein [Desulfitobacterium dichloroeliminans]
MKTISWLNPKELGLFIRPHLKNIYLIRLSITWTTSSAEAFMLEGRDNPLVSEDGLVYNYR